MRDIAPSKRIQEHGISWQTGTCKLLVEGGLSDLQATNIMYMVLLGMA